MTSGKVTEWEFGEAGGGNTLYHMEDDNVYLLPMEKASTVGDNPEGFQTNLGSYPLIADYILITDDYFSVICNTNANEFGFRYAFYDSNKDYISTVNWNGYARTISNTDFKSYIYSVPSGASYIRVQYRNQNMDYLTLVNRYLYTIDDSESLAWDIDRNAFKLRAFLGIPNINGDFLYKNVICIGDSITENNQHNNNKSWCEYLTDIFGMKVYNNGKSGTGLIKGYGSYRGACNRVDANDFYSGVVPDLILIMGNGNDATAGAFYDYDGNSVTVVNEHGANVLPVGTPSDASSALTVYGAMRHLFESLITKYPLAKIGFITSTPRKQDLTSWWGASKANFYGHGAFDDYVTAIKWVCAEYNIPCLDLYHGSIFRPWNTTNANAYYADGETHPNTLGTVEGIVKPVCKWIWRTFY